MTFPRRQFLHLAASAVALPALSRVAVAQVYPSRPVRIIVPFAAGGGTDITARVIAQWLSERLGQQFVIENRLNFNFLRDIAPVTGIIRVPLVMEVNPSLPAKTVSEFIGYAKANPGKVNMASAGSGAPNHVSGELFKAMIGVNMLHVPYRGSPPALTDLVGGQVQVMFDPMP